MKEKTKRIWVYMPEHLDKQILRLAQTHFNNDYSKTIRFLCQLGLLINKRLDGKLMREVLET